MVQESLKDQMDILIAKLRPEQIIPPTEERVKEELVGWLDPYLRQLYTLRRLLLGECNTLAQEVEDLERRVHASMSRKRPNTKLISRLVQMKKLLFTMDMLSSVVDVHFKAEVLLRNPEMDDSGNYVVYSDWSFGIPEEWVPPGENLRITRPGDKQRQRLPRRAPDGRLIQ